MTTPRIVNIINFIRALDAPGGRTDLYEPLVHQLRLCKQFDLPATFLLEYDALIEPRYVGLLKAEIGSNGNYEIGGWLEIVQPLVEKAGLKWRGRCMWDSHAHVAFSPGYTPDERERLVDVYMTDFRKTFGSLPRSMGSWFMDAHTLAYMADKYEIIGSCNCKDQVGTDGYTLWGGYWNQAYYPSRKNAFMPAQTADAQIPVPVFRMLGSDPIYQYENGIGTDWQNTSSLEPVYVDTGGNPEWVRWFFDVLRNHPCVSFAYAQAGQENSFSWPAMAQGYADQMEFLAGLARQGGVRIETLETSAAWFRDKYNLTPPSAITALSDPRNQGRKAVWYNSRFYRTSLAWNKSDFLVRDIHLFNQDYAERYLSEVCTTAQSCYDTLPVLDGFRWSSAGRRAGIRLVGKQGGTPLMGSDPTVTEPGNGVLKVNWPLKDGGSLDILCEEGAMTFSATGLKHWMLELSWCPAKKSAVTGVRDNAIEFMHEGFTYEVMASSGSCARADEPDAIILKPSNGALQLVFGGLSGRIRSSLRSRGYYGRAGYDKRTQQGAFASVESTNAHRAK